MVGLKMVIRVPLEKQGEFVLSTRSFLSEGSARPQRILCMQDMDDATRICWTADWETSAALKEFTESDAFKALRGAARLLGSLEQLEIVEPRSDVAIGR